MVLLSLLATTFGLIAFASAAAAPEVTDSPTNIMYLANFNTTISGMVMFSSTNGSVLVAVNLDNLPSAGGPFNYEIHERPVPMNGSCMDTMGVLNPYNGTVNATAAAEMQVGNLSGKHGSISGPSARSSYIDPYLSLNMRDRAFVGDLSVVVGSANNTRIACAHIEMMRFAKKGAKSGRSSGRAGSLWRAPEQAPGPM